MIFPSPRPLVSALLLLCMLCASTVRAEQSPDELRVGVRNVPPFAMQTDDGQSTGVTVELWQRIAGMQGWKTRWVELDSAKDQVNALDEDRVDIAVGALSMTAERESRIDFSHAFFSTGLAIATPVRDTGWLSLLGQLLSPAFLGAVGILVLLLLGVGVLIWLIERRRNPDHFGGSAAQGIGNGFWWSAVTMTTVGYGDKAPSTAPGRLLATVWMFFSVITISGFTASIASSVTLNQTRTAISGVQDLDRARTLAVEGSTGEIALSERLIRSRSVPSPEQGLEAITERDADALVYDEAVLRFLLRDSEDDIRLIDFPGGQQEYGLGLQEGFAHREALNRSLLEVVRGEQWQQTLRRYLGAS